MDVGIALPNTIRGATREQLLEWARRAESRGFSSLGTIDRIVYDNYEPLLALAAAAAVTERIGLATTVLLAPLRENAVELAKQAATLQALSNGRFTLGVGLGGRDDDYAASGIETSGRGDRLDEMLETIRKTWSEDEVGPSTDTPPRLIVGGHVDAAVERAVRFADGWIAGGSGPEEFASVAKKVKDAWSDAGRDGEPHLMALAYFSLGDRAEEDARDNLAHYYAWLGEDVANMIVDGAAKDAETVKQYFAAYEEAGCDELVFCPSSADAQQVDLLADAAGL
jgi:alkanesulfonate monooxygenase SsuD/methylene tetrahydromethanopterin reductase-like flavin-dependent oxidoreductase (luciferase family)